MCRSSRKLVIHWRVVPLMSFFLRLYRSLIWNILLKVPEMSRDRAVVIWLDCQIQYMCSVTIYKMSSLEMPFHPPRWMDRRMFFMTKRYCNLSVMMASITLLRVLSNIIGRYNLTAVRSFDSGFFRITMIESQK